MGFLSGLGSILQTVAPVAQAVGGAIGGPIGGIVNAVSTGAGVMGGLIKGGTPANTTSPPMAYAGGSQMYETPVQYYPTGKGPGVVPDVGGGGMGDMLLPLLLIGGLVLLMGRK